VMIRRALEETGGSKQKAALLLDVNYKRLLARVRELGIEEDSIA
jgi:DNA-binding NtrC family response regulator